VPFSATARLKSNHADNSATRVVNAVQLVHSQRQELGTSTGECEKCHYWMVRLHQYMLLIMTCQRTAMRNTLLRSQCEFEGVGGESVRAVLPYRFTLLRVRQEHALTYLIFPGARTLPEDWAGTRATRGCITP